MQALKKIMKKISGWFGRWKDKTIPPKGLDVKMAHDLATLCSEIRSIEVANNPRLYQSIENKELDVQVGIFKLSKTACAIVFRGTEPWNLKDWKTNAQFINRKPGDNFAGKVHLGYHAAYHAVAKTIKKAMRSLEVAKVYCAGFSMGGPLAQQCAMDMRAYGYISACYTFGSPKTGDKTFAKSHSQIDETWRIRLQNDVVPALPPFKIYKHAGKPVRIHSKGYYMKKLDELADWVCTFSPWSYKDHSVEGYVKALEKLL